MDLAQRPAAAQMRLMSLVWDAIDADGQWPVYDYVARALEATGVDLEETLSDLPRIGPYSLVWAASIGGMSQPDSPVGLTVAGLSHVEGAERFIDAFLKYVRWLADQWARVPNHPRRPGRLETTRRDLVGCIADRPGGVDKRLIDVAELLLPHEPCTWNGNRMNSGEDWTWQVPRTITRFGDVAGVEDYLSRTAEMLAPSDAPGRFMVESRHGPDMPLDSTTVDPELWDYLASLITNGHWPHVASGACRFLEHQIRSWAQATSDVDAPSLVGGLFGRGAPLALGDNEGQRQGWESIIRGFLMGPRNAVQHGVDARPHDELRRFAAGAVGTVTMILVEIRSRYPKRLEHPAVPPDA